MNQKIIAVLCAAVLTICVLASCGQQTTQAQYIGLDAAKAIALESAGVAESAATFSTTGLDSRDGTDFYAVDFTANGQSYEYDIDAITGVVIDSSSSPASAGTDAGASPDGNTGSNTGTDTGAASGGNTGSSGTGAAITEEEAKEIALSHAGLSSDQVTFLRSKLDYDDGRQVYDVEFYTSDYKEYDYEIDASTGTVLSYDFDAEGYTPSTGGTTSAITADQAKQIALAEVPGATESDIYEFEVDRDDGRIEYEGSIYYDGTEYEFTIDGYSGAIRSWEAEPTRR